MMGSLRQSMSWLHTWCGLIIGWLLFLIFLTGGASLWKQELHAWLRPEIIRTVDNDTAIENAIAWLSTNAAGAPYWNIRAPDDRTPMLETYWVDTADEFHLVMLDGATGAPVVARDTQGGEFFYRFHFELAMPYPWGRWLAGIAAMGMLVALISGVITHKRAFADFFTFRRNKNPQRVWLDAHNVFGVLALPFHLMIAFTGLITMASMYMPWPTEAAFVGSNTTYGETRYTDSFTSPEREGPAPLAAMRPMLDDAARAWNAPVARLTILNPGDKTARVELIRGEAGRIAMYPPSMLYEGGTGRRITQRLETRPAALTEDVLYGLHMARFGDVLMRWLYFVGALAGAAMIASGMVLYTVKRAADEPTHWRRIVHTLNVGAILGGPLMIAAFLCANRLLPTGIAGRADLEVQAFLWMLPLSLTYAAVRGAPAAWRELSFLAALFFLAAPALTAALTSRGLPHSIPQGDWAMAGIDLALTAIGLGFALMSLRLHQRQSA